jgi:hypothetical protein
MKRPKVQNQSQIFTQNDLKSILNYNSESGIFVWISPPNDRIPFGSIAGSYDGKGYLRIKIDGKHYYTHRLAWLYMTGEWPKDQIDHLDNIKDNNAWSNLREADNSQNQINTPCKATNKYGIKGVYKCHGKYRAQIQVNGRKIYLGAFLTPEDARNAYNDAAVKLHKDFTHITVKS